MKTGIQVSSLKPLLTGSAGVDAVFEKIAQMGVTTVQHQWIDRGVSPETVAALTEKWGLRSLSVQDFFIAVRACLETKVPYGFVEQERWDRDPWDCLGEALDWLHREMEEAV